MEPLQPLCASTVLCRTLQVAVGLVSDRVIWPKHDECPLSLAVAFRRQPNMSDEDMDTYAELSALGKPVPRDIMLRYEGYSITTLPNWSKCSIEQQEALSSDGDIGAVGLIHSSHYDDHLIVEVTFRDTPDSCMHTALPFGAYLHQEGEDPDKAPPRAYMFTPWRKLLMETDLFVRHPVLPRRFVPRLNTHRLWSPPGRIE